jgi:limonene-1,2-epoxide hydrolase
MGTELDPRHANEFSAEGTTGRDHVGHHQIEAESAQLRSVVNGHPGRSPVNLGTGVVIVVSGGRIQPEQLDGLDTGGARSIEPLDTGQEDRIVTGRQELQTQRDRRERVPRVRPGDHAHTHRPTLSHAAVTTLTTMTEQLPDISVQTEPARVVETFLYALRDKDFDAMDVALDDDVIYQNVGYPTIRGRKRTMKFARGLARPSLRFDVKFHRIATEGTAILTERTDMLAFGRFEAYFWVCGVFEVRDGRITLWRDYFDNLDVLKGIIRGLAGLAVPSLQRSL